MSDEGQPSAEQAAAEALAGLSLPSAEQIEAASALANLSEQQLEQSAASPEQVGSEVPPIEGGEQQPQLTEAQQEAVRAAMVEFSRPIELPENLEFNFDEPFPGDVAPSEDAPPAAEPVEGEGGGLPQPEFVGGAILGAAPRNQRMKSKYICVASGNGVAGTEIRPKYQDQWQPLGYNAFNPKEYWEHMEKFKRGEEPAPPPLPSLFYYSMIQGSDRVRRNDLKKKQVQRCIGLLKPCPPGRENCPGQLNNVRTSTMQGKRINPSIHFQERIRTGDIAEPPRIVGCLVADDDLGGKSRGDAAPFREFKPKRDPVTGKLMPLPPDNFPIDVCTEKGFRNFIANEQPYIPDKPNPGETIPQIIVNKDNGIFSNHPFEISLYFFILKSFDLLQPLVARNAQFIQLLISTDLPAGGPARKIRQFYIEPEKADLQLPNNLGRLNVDLSKGIEYWTNRRADLESVADQIGELGGQGMKDTFMTMMRLSFQVNQDILQRKLKQMLTRGQPVGVVVPPVQGPIIPIIPLEELAIVQPQEEVAPAGGSEEQPPSEIVLEKGSSTLPGSAPSSPLPGEVPQTPLGINEEEIIASLEAEAPNIPPIFEEELEKEEIPESEIPIEQPVPGSEGSLQSPSQSSSLESLAVQTPEIIPQPEQPVQEPPVIEEEEIEIPLENM